MRDTEKTERYESLHTQLRGLLDGNADMIANMANVCAAIQQSFNFHWVGFYRVVGEQLVLGPFQGPPACVSIAQGRGVCGAAWQSKQTLIVDDVHAFPGHIACSPFSRSEIVVPVFGQEADAAPIKDDGNKTHTHNKTVVAVLDIDADVPAAFDDCDKQYLERFSAMLSVACAGDPP